MSKVLATMAMMAAALVGAAGPKAEVERDAPRPAPAPMPFHRKGKGHTRRARPHSKEALLRNREERAKRLALRKARRAKFLPSPCHPAAPMRGERVEVNRKLRNQLKRLRKGGTALLREKHIARATEDTRRTRKIERGIRRDTRRELGREASAKERRIADYVRVGLVGFERVDGRPGWRCFDAKDPYVGGERQTRHAAFDALQQFQASMREQ